MGLSLRLRIKEHVVSCANLFCILIQSFHNFPFLEDHGLRLIMDIYL